MNLVKSQWKIFLLLTCAIALLSFAPVALAAGGDEMEAEPQPATAVTSAPAEVPVAGETDVLHAPAVRGLPFSNFDLLALIAVVVGLTTISFTVHRLNRDPDGRRPAPRITTDAR